MISDKALYLVKIESWGDDQPVILGLAVEVHEDYMGFHDTVRGHHINGRLEKETEDGFVWHRIENRRDRGNITLRALTLDEFNRVVRPGMDYPPPEFLTTEDLWEFYRRKFGDRGSHY
ncbi:MAG: hypothetical protein A4E56_00144 [Pelotomaculum sp. PtaU1.Bin065]|nr:MAG: hypothetical protein A4E56_00144 [Pelotomaculum sp. PtaU1.Bin065]